MIEKRQLAGRMVHPVGLGCMNLSWAYGDPPPHDDKLRLLERALELGYDHFDTANIYGLGRNESLLGEGLSGRRADFLLASKTGIVADGDRRGIDCSPAAMTASIDASLQRLKTDRIDLLYMHRLDRTVPIPDMVGTLARAIEAGKIGAYGVSEWGADSIRAAHAIHPMAAVQTEYSLWTRNPEIAVLEATRALGIAFVAFSPLARGALGGVLRDPAALQDKDLRRTMPRFSPDNWPANRALIDQFDALAGDAGVAPAQLALGWLLAQGPHVHVIPGTTSIAHLEENFATLAIDLPEAVLAQAGALIGQHTVSGARYAPAAQASVDTEEFA
jgi:aryl-alcohol dehydrogenase-like predicted oxidoreductase